MEYKMVTPSRKRSHLMKQLLALLPDTTVCVREDEYEDYRTELPPDQLVVIDKPVTNITETRQWMLDHFTEETLIFMDDDLKHVRAVVGERPRLIKDPAGIKQILLNSAAIANDLNLPLFGYNVRPDPLRFLPFDPISLVTPAFGFWGIIGRKYRLDFDLTAREDIDLSLQVLLQDRIIFVDERFYFDGGPTWVGAGGDQGIRNSATELKDREILQRKWGSFLSLTGNAYGTGVTACSIKVTRK